MRRLLAVAVATVVLGCPIAAHAQSKDDIARADALFNAAKALTDSGQYADACAKFAESKRLAPGLGVTMYLADCYEHIGRTASAWTEFRAAEGLARARNDKRADVARQHAEALEPKLDRLKIEVAPSVPRVGLSILRDGLPVSSDELGLAVPVDPGDHAVIVSAPGHAQRTLDAHVGPEAPSATVRIDSLDEAPASAPVAPAPVTPPPAAPAPTPPDQSDNPGGTQRILGLVGMGVGIVGLGVGSVFGILAKSALDGSNSGPCNASDKCDAAGLADRQDASNKATLSTVFFVGGGIIGAAGVVVYLTAPRAPAATGLTLTPAPMVGGGGALLGGRF
jgi:serine/threonine-protein kinase